nr:ammonium transporter [Acinetobacter baumannii]
DLKATQLDEMKAYLLALAEA